jgi:hypothetical protein
MRRSQDFLGFFVIGKVLSLQEARSAEEEIDSVKISTAIEPDQSIRCCNGTYCCLPWIYTGFS